MIFEPNFINKSKKVTALISQPENGCVSKKVYKIEFKPEKNRSKDYSRLICNNEECIINLIIENNYIINRFGFISYRIDELIRKTKKKEKGKNKNKTLI